MSALGLTWGLEVSTAETVLPSSLASLPLEEKSCGDGGVLRLGYTAGDSVLLKRDTQVSSSVALFFFISLTAPPPPFFFDTILNTYEEEAKYLTDFPSFLLLWRASFWTWDFRRWPPRYHE
jgi:hypothetical protein